MFRSQRFPVFREHYFHIKRTLDRKRIEKALKSFEGLHDFAAFAKASGKAVESFSRGTKRRVLSAKLKVSKHPGMAEARIFEFRFRAEGFLQHMVRNMVGTLVEIGLGESISIPNLYKSRRRADAGRAAPAAPLVLVKTKVAPGLCCRLASAPKA
jgi:tRNA pseudouridine38-40 synthase